MSTRNNSLAASRSPLLCYVTDRQTLAAANPAESLTGLSRKIEEIVRAGIDWVQIREKDLPAAELASLTRQSLRIAPNASVEDSFPIRVLVNDRLDVAMAERAGGVHLGGNSLPVRETQQLVASALGKQLVDETFLVGVSCHSLVAAEAAERDGAHYLFFGPVFATPSKARFGSPQGPERLKEVCRAVSIPVVAIGGVTLDNAESCVAAGAEGIAAIRLFQDASEPVSVIRRLHQLLRAYHRRPEPAGPQILYRPR